MLKYSYAKHPLKFNFNAKTSRGEIKTHASFIIQVTDTNNKHIIGLGEAAPLEGLSIDFSEHFEQNLKHVLDQLNQQIPLEFINLDKLPSIKFALEVAHLDLKNGGNKLIFKNNFFLGEPILINGLVWMANKDDMYAEAIKKISEGFNCLKFKIGALDFDEECTLIESIRKKYNAFNLEIRLDANGAFLNDEAKEKLKELSRFDIHSIEQPIKPYQTDFMQEICATSKIPIALDEELIGIDLNDAGILIKKIKPSYIILKPTLIGGLLNADYWINAAQKNNVKWWATSALESSIGLNAIAQWVFEKKPVLHQGLGTGAIYSNNFASPLQVTSGKLLYNNTKKWDVNISE